MKKNCKNLFTYSLNHFFTSQKPVKNLLPYSLNPFFSKKNGFTLAEVLIVIGVIGVVAAITIPTLIANANSKKISSQFKKSIAALNQAVKLGEANYDLNFSNTESCYVDNGTPIENGGKSLCSIFASTMKISPLNIIYISGNSGEINLIPSSEQKYKLTSIENWLANEDYITYQFLDGAILFVIPGAGPCTLADGVITYSEFNSDISNPGCRAFIDVNGLTLPNKEVTCTTGTTSTDLTEPCTVKNSKDMGDIFPIAFFDGTVVPMTNAAKYVLNNAK